MNLLKKLISFLTSVMLVIMFFGCFPENVLLTGVSAETKQEVLKIDIDNNNEVNITDLLSLKKQVLGISNNAKYCDLNEDNTINILDVLELKNTLLYSNNSDYFQVKDPQITLDGTADSTANLITAICSWYSASDSTIRNTDVHINELNTWSTDVIDLDIGTNYITMTFTYDDDSIVTKEYIVQRLSNEIQLNDNVKIINDTENTLSDIIDIIFDSKETDDTSDDEINLLVSSENSILKDIQNGDLVENDIIYMPSSEEFPTGLSLQFLYVDNDYDTSYYNNDTYTLIHTKQAELLDLFSNDNACIDCDTVDTNDIMWIPYEYDDNALNQAFNQQEDALEVFEDSVISNRYGDFNYFLSGTPTNTTQSDKDLCEGLNLNELVKNFSYDWTGNTLSFGIKNAKIIDMDGYSSTTYDQLRFSLTESIKFDNIEFTHEAYSNGSLGKLTFRLDYTNSQTAGFEGSLKASLKDVIKAINSTNNTSSSTNTTNTTTNTNNNTTSNTPDGKIKTNLFGKYNIEVSGINFNDKILIGMIGLNLTNRTFVGKSTLLDKDGNITELEPLLLGIVYIDLDGNLSCEFSANYTSASSHVSGFNLQNTKFKDKKGKTYKDYLSENEQNNEYFANKTYVLSTYDGNDSKVTKKSLNVKLTGKVNIDVAPTVGIGLSLGGIIPYMITLKVPELYYNAEGSLSGKYNFLSNQFEGSFGGKEELEFKASINALVKLKFAIKDDSQNKDVLSALNINETFPFETTIAKSGCTTFSGYVYSKDTNAPIENAYVFLRDYDGNEFKTFTDDNGYFIMDNLIPYGKYSLVVANADYTAYQDIQYTISHSKDCLNLSFKLEPINAHGELVTSGYCGDEDENDGKNVTWELYEDGTLIISGTGNMRDYYSTPWSKYTTIIKSAIINDGVTSIGYGAFDDCTSLTSINIPDSVTSIGDSAFYHCTSLTSINIPDSITSIGEYAFYNCTSLTSINIPDSVTSISYMAFYSCTSLASINIPDSVTSIGGWAFKHCTSLTSINIPNIVTSIGDSAFYNCTSLTSINIPNSVTSIGDSAFYNCTSLTSINIPDSITSIGEYAFYNCTSLTNIEIPNSVTSIGYSAFKNCTALTSINIPDSVTSIGRSAFENCTLLTNINIPDNVTYIGSYAFDGCTSLTSINIPDGVTYIGDFIFFNCTSLTNISIPDSVTDIGNSAFENCTSLTSINIPDGVTYIYNGAFEKCSALTSINIPDGVTSIGDRAFKDCTSLTSIEIPDSVTYIGNFSFENCTSLKDIYYGGTEEQWDSIGGTYRDYPDDVIIHYNSTIIDDSSNDNTETTDNICGDYSTWTYDDGTLTINGQGSIYDYASQSAPWYALRESINKLVISDDIQGIGNCAFEGLSNITEITLPSKLCTIGDYAFDACTSLKSITVPNTTYSLGECVFGSCTSLENVVFGNNVTKFNDNLFYDCISLKTVTVWSNISSIGNNVFYNCPSDLTVIAYNSNDTLESYVTECGYNFEYNEL